jgi:hypothetical protein
MNWTTETPSVSGFYFYRKDSLVVAAQLDEKMILRLTNGWYGTLQAFSGKGEWYGPLQLPPGTFPRPV